MKVNLTDKLIRALKPGKAREEYWDASFHDGAFGLRVAPTGRKAWQLLYRNSHGRLRRLNLGTFPSKCLKDAEKDARLALAEVARGKDPAQEKRDAKHAATFGGLFEQYLERHAKPNIRTWQEDERSARVDILPFWEHRTPQEITRQDVIAVCDRIVDRGSPIKANRTLGLICRVFNWGLARGLVENNPAFRLPKPGGKEGPRTRVLTREELKAVWKTLDTFPLLTGATFRLRLLTLQRDVEVRSMRWKDVDGATWVIPPEVSKSGRQHRVPLSRQVLELLETLKPYTGDHEYVFPARDGEGHFGKLKKAGQRLRTQTKLDEDKTLQDFRGHDLRRTGATFLVSELNIPETVVSRILGHARRGVTLIHYMQHDYFPEMGAALQRWADWVEDLVTGKERKIVEFPRKKRARA